jgi:hypothetical protein
MVKVEVNGVVLHIPDGWDVFSYHGTWYVKDEAGHFFPLATPRRSGSEPLVIRTHAEADAP